MVSTNNYSGRQRNIEKGDHALLRQWLTPITKEHIIYSLKLSPLTLSITHSFKINEYLINSVVEIPSLLSLMFLI